MSTPAIEAGSGPYRRVLLALFGAGVATFAQMYAPQGLLPMLSADFGVSISDSSWAVGAATIGVAVGVLPWARLADRIGRVSAMRLSVFAALVIGVAVPLWPDFGGIVALRFLEGVALAGLPAIAVTYINEEIAPRAAGLAAGTFIAGNTLGGLAGRLLATPIGDALGWRFGLAAVTALSALAVVVFLVAVPPPARFVRQDPATRPSLAGAVLANLRDPGLRVLFAQAFLLMGGFVAVYNYLSFRLEAAPYWLTPTSVSFLFLAYLAGAASSRAVWRFVAGRTLTGVLLAAIGVMLVGLGLTLLEPIALILLGLVIFTVGFFAAHSIASGMIGPRAGRGNSQAAALYNLCYYAGSGVLGWVGGQAFSAWGWPGVVGMVAVLATIAALLAWRYARARGGFAAADRPA